jgi:acetyl esterase
MPNARTRADSPAVASPEVAALLERITPTFPPLGTAITDADEARRAYDALRTGAPPRTDVPVRDTVADGLALRWYEPAAAPAEHTIVYFHGGGFVLGGLDSHDELARRLAVASATTVVATDYRRAPEHPHPAPLDDARSAVAHVRAARPRSTIIVAGDSAGGNLAAALCLHARDHGDPPPAGQVLVYPMLDDRCATASYAENAEGFYVTAGHLRWFWRQYGSGDYSAPARLDLHDLPPAVIVTAGLDPLRDEGLAYADRLAKAGVRVRPLHYADAFHGFLAFDVDLTLARTAMAEIGEAVGALWPAP